MCGLVGMDQNFAGMDQNQCGYGVGMGVKSVGDGWGRD